MAGRGPTPKSPDARARANRDPIATTKLPFVRAKQPELPKAQPDGSLWPARTRSWWRRWKTDPRSQRFDAAAWDELLDTAVVHARLWSGDWKAASELRLRTARFGVTPEDRARLRISLSDGLEDVSEPEAKQEGAPAASGARQRYGQLKVV